MRRLDRIIWSVSYRWGQTIVLLIPEIISLLGSQCFQFFQSEINCTWPSKYDAAINIDELDNPEECQSYWLQKTACTSVPTNHPVVLTHWTSYVVLRSANSLRSVTSVVSSSVTSWLQTKIPSLVAWISDSMKSAPSSIALCHEKLNVSNDIPFTQIHSSVIEIPGKKTKAIVWQRRKWGKKKDTKLALFLIPTTGHMSSTIYFSSKIRIVVLFSETSVGNNFQD